MVALQKFLRSFTREPDAQSGDEIRVIPFSESPFVDVSSIPLLSEDDSEKLAPIAPEDSFKSQLPLLGRAYTSAPLDAGRKTVVDLRRLSAAEVQAHQDQHAEEDETGPPAWLGIFFDLAWTTTFSNLTSNTQLTTISTLLSYTVFFILAWWLWAAQVTYDSKYFRNDWFHRAMLLVQLTIFGSLAAFTKDFNPFSTRVNPKESPMEDYVKDQYARKSMLGISGLFASTRVFLIISYARVLYYLPVRNPTARAQRRRLILQVITYTTSCLLFAMAYVVVKYDLEQSAVWARLLLWVSGVGVEVASYLIVPDVDARLLANMDTMGERLSSLTSIILGEGLNSLAGTLVLSASAIGFDAKTGGVAASATVVITFAFLLYFDGFKRRTPATRHRSKWNVALHFPLHLSIIVLLEAMKNGLIYSSIWGIINGFVDRLDHPKHGESAEDAMFAAFRNVGVDFNQTMYDALTEMRMANKTAPDDLRDWNEIVNKAFAQLFLNVFERFDIASDAMKANFTQYIRAVGGAARTDNMTEGRFAPEPYLDDSVHDVQASAIWILLSGAVFLACLGVITLVNSWVPKHRYIWGSVLSRWTMAGILALLSLLGTNRVNWQKLQDQAMLGAIVAMAFIFQFGIDHLVIWIASRRQKYWRRMGSHSSIS